MSIDDWTEFDRYHARNREQARRLHGFIVLFLGVGAVGSHASAILGQAGCRLVLFDRDVLDAANATRHYVTERAAIGQPKSHALARKLRSEIPKLQTVRGIKGDAEQLSDAELRALLSGVSLVVGSSGRNSVDHRINRAARDLGLPLVVPSLWGDNEMRVLGDVHVIAWHLGRARRGACFECMRPATADTAAPAEAQPGMGAEVIRVASATAEIVLALFLSDSPQHRALLGQLSRGINYFVIPRWPPTLRSVITPARADCPACSPGSAAARTRSDADDMRVIRDISVWAVLGSTVLWHQLVPGFDYVAAIVLVAAGGLWWGGRLPSFDQAATWIRRQFS